MFDDYRINYGRMPLSCWQKTGVGLIAAGILLFPVIFFASFSGGTGSDTAEVVVINNLPEPVSVQPIAHYGQKDPAETGNRVTAFRVMSGWWADDTPIALPTEPPIVVPPGGNYQWRYSVGFLGLRVTDLLVKGSGWEGVVPYSTPLVLASKDQAQRVPGLVERRVDAGTFSPGLAFALAGFGIFLLIPVALFGAGYMLLTRRWCGECA